MKAWILFWVILTLWSAGGIAQEVRFDLIQLDESDGYGRAYYEPEELSPGQVIADSSLSGYEPSLVVDGRADTAWFEGAPGWGLGQKLVVPLQTPPRAMEVRPGWQRSEALFLRNGRPSTLAVRFVGHEPGYEPEVILEYQVDLSRNYDGTLLRLPQYIYFPPGDFLQNMALIDFTHIELEILEVDNSGATDPDTGISELRFFGLGDLVGVRGPRPSN